MNYPFDHLGQDLTAALCAANPDVTSLTISVELRISGETGCGGDPVPIANNVRINCSGPIGDGGASEVFDDDQPAIGDDGSWECVGDDCEGGAAPADAPPAVATYRPLPFIRLPGNDLRLIEMSAPNWLLCRQACTEDARCGAWTYRSPTAESGPVCLLKSRAGVIIPDPCCRSGVKN